VLVWDVPAALGRDGAIPSDPEACWKDLAGDDALAASRAAWHLAKMPDKGLPLLRERLRPVARVEARHIDRLIADLDDNDFAVRGRAKAALGELGELAEVALRKAYRESTSEEVRARAEELISKIAAPVPPPDQVRLLRALAALEEMATPEARRLLESLADGAPEARLTQEARAVLARLAK
jgi:hypothetical protein